MDLRKLPCLYAVSALPVFRFSFIIFLALALVLPALLCPRSLTAQSKPASRRERDAAKWARKTLKKMSLDEKIGQLFLVSYFGGFTSTESEEYRNLLQHIERHRVGGFAVRTRSAAVGFSRSQVYPTAVLANQLQRRSKFPLLVAADFERGTAMRLEEGTSFPHAMAVAATGDPRDAYTMGRITAIEARSAGVHWLFAPVADVNNNPDNPIINTRSFGEDPRRVSDFVAAFTRGVEEHGALSTAKHFPGHGDTATDSHISLPAIRADRARLDAVELPPFQAALAAGARAVMTGHLAVTALEPDENVPATLSPPVLTGLLRQTLAFDGIVVTDALDMGGITVRSSPGEVAVRSILAGADMLLVSPATDAAFNFLKEAVQSGRLPLQRVEQSVARILRAKAFVGLHKQRLVDIDGLNAAFRRPEFLAAAQDIADRGVTLLRDAASLVPLDSSQRRRILLFSVSGDPEIIPGDDFERELRSRGVPLTVVRTDTRFSRPEHVQLPAPDSYDLAIVSIFVRVADRKATVGLPANQAALVNQLLAAGKPVIVVCFGNPYLIREFPSAPSWLAAFSTVDVAQRAAARALLGLVPIIGQLPVSVPGIAPIGHGLRVPASSAPPRP